METCRFYCRASQPVQGLHCGAAGEKMTCCCGWMCVCVCVCLCVSVCVLREQYVPDSDMRLVGTYLTI